MTCMTSMTSMAGLKSPASRPCESIMAASGEPPAARARGAESRRAEFFTLGSCTMVSWRGRACGQVPSRNAAGWHRNGVGTGSSAACVTHEEANPIPGEPLKPDQCGKNERVAGPPSGPVFPSSCPILSQFAFPCPTKPVRMGFLIPPELPACPAFPDCCRAWS